MNRWLVSSAMCLFTLLASVHSAVAQSSTIVQLTPTIAPNSRAIPEIGSASMDRSGRFVMFDVFFTNAASGYEGSVNFFFDRAAGTVEPLFGHGYFPIANPAFISTDGKFIIADPLFSLVGQTIFNNQLVSVERSTGVIELLSVSPSGKPANGPSRIDAVSPDTMFVLFSSRATNLVPETATLPAPLGTVAGFFNTGDFVGCFLLDRRSSEIKLISQNAGGTEAAACQGMSDEGRFIVYSQGVNDSSSDHLTLLMRDVGVASAPVAIMTLPFGYPTLPHAAVNKDASAVIFRTESGEYWRYERATGQAKRFYRGVLESDSPLITDDGLFVVASDLIRGIIRVNTKTGAIRVMDAARKFAGGSLRLDRFGLNSTANDVLARSNSQTFNRLYRTDGGPQQVFLNRAQFLIPLNACPDTSRKLHPGVCGCGAFDRDVNEDAVIECGTIRSAAANQPPSAPPIALTSNLEFILQQYLLESQSGRAFALSTAASKATRRRKPVRATRYSYEAIVNVRSAASGRREQLRRVIDGRKNKLDLRRALAGTDKAVEDIRYRLLIQDTKGRIRARSGFSPLLVVPNL